jgi:hypothetical protein
MMNEDLREALPLGSLDRRGDGRLGESPEMAPEMARVRRAPQRATTDHIAALAIIRRTSRSCGCGAPASVRVSN